MLVMLNARGLLVMGDGNRRVTFVMLGIVVR
jgi:hypothetical protein